MQEIDRRDDGRTAASLGLRQAGLIGMASLAVLVGAAGFWDGVVQGNTTNRNGHLLIVSGVVALAFAIPAFLLARSTPERAAAVLLMVFAAAALLGATMVCSGAGWGERPCGTF